MARREIPAEYAPSAVPIRGRDESAESYVDRLGPFLQDELSRIRDHFEQQPIIRLAYDAPRAPFTGMTVFAGLPGGWNPGSGLGLYLYVSGSGWYRFFPYGPYIQG